MTPGGPLLSILYHSWSHPWLNARALELRNRSWPKLSPEPHLAKKISQFFSGSPDCGQPGAAGGGGSWVAPPRGGTGWQGAKGRRMRPEMIEPGCPAMAPS